MRTSSAGFFENLGRNLGQTWGGLIRAGSDAMATQFRGTPVAPADAYLYATPTSGLSVDACNRNRPDIQQKMESLLSNLGVDLAKIRKQGTKPLVSPAQEIAQLQLPQKTRKPKALIIGAGGIGAGIAEQLAAMGIEVTVVARSPYANSADPEKNYVYENLIRPNGIKTIAVDAFSAKPDDQAVLAEALASNDWVFVSKTTGMRSIAEAAADAAGSKRLVEALASANYTAKANLKREKNGEPPKRLIYVDSPVSRCPTEKMGMAPLAEDCASVADLVDLTGTNRRFQTPYYFGKVATDAVLQDAMIKGLDGVTISPTYVVTQWGDHGGKDPIIQMYKEDLRSTPSTVCDAIAVEDVGRQAIAAAMFGRRGDNYLITGISQQTGVLAALTLQQANFPLGLLPGNHAYNQASYMLNCLKLLQDGSNGDLVDGLTRSQLAKRMTESDAAVLMGMGPRYGQKARDEFTTALNERSDWSSVFTDDQLDSLYYPDRETLVASLLTSVQGQGRAMVARGRFH